MSEPWVDESIWESAERETINQDGELIEGFWVDDRFVAAVRPTEFMGDRVPDWIPS